MPQNLKYSIRIKSVKSYIMFWKENQKCMSLWGTVEMLVLVIVLKKMT